MAHNILTIKNALVKLSPTRTTPVFTEFGDAVDQAKVNISSDDFTWTPVSGTVQNQVGALKYEVALNLGQDTKTGGLMQFLVSNHGASGKIEFYPKGGTTPKFAGDIVIKAPDGYGGGVGVATAAVTMKIDGTPAITWEP
jgi:hypothetical protein